MPWMEEKFSKSQMEPEAPLHKAEEDESFNLSLSCKFINLATPFKNWLFFFLSNICSGQILQICGKKFSLGKMQYVLPSENQQLLLVLSKEQQQARNKMNEDKALL